ncbi:MAG: NAD+ synthase [Planctomycetota bacterium]
MTLPDPPGIHAPLAEKVLSAFLFEECNKFGFSRGVLGLSGGVDSAVVLELAARGLGAGNVRAFALPYRTSQRESLVLAREAAAHAGVALDEIDITPMADAHLEAAGLKGDDTRAGRLRRGNILARTRMVVLYDRSAAEKALVLGTSNKTELLLGYGTLFGDLSSAVNPVGDLYKSQIFSLARHLGVPEAILARPPSGDLWEGQTDEDELGFSYAAVDALLNLWIDRRYPRPALEKLGFPGGFLDQVLVRVHRNQFKRMPPVIAKLANRTINLDFRYPRDITAGPGT